MPIANLDDYRPPVLLKNGHLNTIFPYLFRKTENSYRQRLRIDTPDGDFFDVDTAFCGSEKLAILVHGLEGSTYSGYMIQMTTVLVRQGWDVIAINFRSCSGEMNRTPKFYHSGFTEDLHMVVSEYGFNYSRLALIGFSLGGNVVLKYTGDGIYEVPPQLTKVVAVSTPVDLASGSKEISKPRNKIYDHNFVKSLKSKIKKKARLGLLDVDLAPLRKVHSLYQFDEKFTAPIHGFLGAKDYYSRCNSRQFLKNIHIPTLLINALDDPFLADECYPYDIAKNHLRFYFLPSKFGGHLGFTTFGVQNYWYEQKIIDFLHDNPPFGGNGDRDRM